MILIIEDEPHIRHLITLNLSRRGHEVISVDSAEAGLEHIRQHVPSLVFLDVRLPGMSGL
jgi:DNA-binding response OmpR family regulator